MTPEELKEIRDRTEKAIKSPWTSYTQRLPKHVIGREDILYGVSGPECRVYQQSITAGHHRDTYVSHRDTSNFIAHSRTDIPKLLDALDLARGAVKTLQQELAVYLRAHALIYNVDPTLADACLLTARTEADKQEPIVSKSQMKRIAALKGLPDPYTDFEGSP